MIFGVGDSSWREECKILVPQIVHNPLNPVNLVNYVSKTKQRTNKL